MPSKSPIIVLILCNSVLRIALSSLHSKFKHFEELKPDRFTTIVKRDAITGRIASKILSFSALSIHFTLSLTPGSPVLDENFQAKTMQANGKTTPISVNKNNFYTGYFNGNPKQGADALFLKGIWLAQLYASDDVYVIEPLRYHDPHGSAQSVIVFRRRDIKEDNDTDAQTFCEEVRFGENEKMKSSKARIKMSSRYHRDMNRSHASHMKTPRMESDKGKITLSTQQNVLHYHGKHPKRPSAKGRGKRSYKKANPTFNTCDVYAIADFNALKGVGGNDPSKLASVLVYIYQGVNQLFRQSAFHNITDYGIVIRAMVIHIDFHITPGHYNLHEKMDALQLLEAVQANVDFSEFCIGHLTTQRLFDKKILGLASIANTSPLDWTNGFCGNRNVGLSTTVSSGNKPLTIAAYQLIVAHEIAHNWGAKHDSYSDPKCSPSAQEGGKFLMWPSTGAAQGPNSRLFSPCSRDAVGNVLRVKAHLCLRPRLNKDVCGNGIIGKAEDCDVGIEKKDPCCTATCRFQPNATCSTINHPCCTKDCHTAPPTQVCHTTYDDNCFMPAHCTGQSFDTCPPPEHRPNNYPCSGGGKCHYGTCMTFCRLLGMQAKPEKQLEPCTCESDRFSMCRHCCRDMSSEGRCKIMGGTYEDGTPCLYGVCNKGVCLQVDYDDIINASSLIFKSSYKKKPSATASAVQVISINIIMSLLLFFSIKQLLK